ncbi:hypothetical protein CCYA_CCYA20G4842 [Cyanidiococcus yangmingshanensis]|nr:hypothetical protein CCYA_CCYA20G4842 [Cyanidiococcus yangmingshanensis]
MMPTGAGEAMEFEGSDTGSLRQPAAASSVDGTKRLAKSASEERLGQGASPARAMRHALRPTAAQQFKTCGRSLALGAADAGAKDGALASRACLRYPELRSLEAQLGGDQGPWLATGETAAGGRATPPVAEKTSVLQPSSTSCSQFSSVSGGEGGSRAAVSLDGGRPPSGEWEGSQRLSTLLNSIEQLQMPSPLTDDRDRLYQVLGIPPDFSNPRQLRNAYLREIWKYHPDRVTALINAYRRSREGVTDHEGSQQCTLEYLESVREAYVARTQEIQLAFETLGDSERRRIYDTFGYRCVRDRRLLNMIIQLSKFIRCKSLKTRQLRERILRTSRNRNDPGVGAQFERREEAADPVSASYGFTGAGGPAYGWWDNGCSAEIAERRGLDRCLNRIPGDNLTCSVSQPENLATNWCQGAHANAERIKPDTGEALSRPVLQAGGTLPSPNAVHELALDLADFYLGRVLRVAIERMGFGLDGTRCREECVLTIQVEPGMRDGDRVEFPGYANATSPGADVGSVIFVLREKQHSRFARVGDDLRMRKKLTLAEALCGYSFTLKLLNGRTIMVQSHDGCVTRPGTVKRIPGKGMPKRRRCPNAPLDFGDLFVEFDVEWPHDGVIRGPVKEQLLAALATIASAGDAPKTRPPEPMDNGGIVTENRTSIESVRTVDEVRPSFDEAEIGALGSALTEDDRGTLSTGSPSTHDDDDDDTDEDAVARVEEIVTAERVRRLPPDWKTCPHCHQTATQRSSSSQQLPRISHVTDSSAREISRSFSLDG